MRPHRRPGTCGGGERGMSTNASGGARAVEPGVRVGRPAEGGATRARTHHTRWAAVPAMMVRAVQRGRGEACARRKKAEQPRPRVAVHTAHGFFAILGALLCCSAAAVLLFACYDAGATLY